MGQEPTPVTTTPPVTDPDVEARRAAARREVAAQRSDDPEAIRRDIAATRTDMEGTLEALNDRVNPHRVYRRRTGRARQRWASFRASVMGSDDPSGSSRSLSDRTPDVDVSGRARQAGQAVGDAPAAAKRRTRGNPLAAGMIAFGVGALIGGALPESDAERRLAREADDQLDLQGTRQRLTERAQQAGQDLKSTAQDKAEDLKTSAQDAAQDVKADARQEGERVRDDAKRSGQRMREQS